MHPPRALPSVDPPLPRRSGAGGRLPQPRGVVRGRGSCVLRAAMAQDGWQWWAPGVVTQLEPNECLTPDPDRRCLVCRERGGSPPKRCLLAQEGPRVGTHEIPVRSARRWRKAEGLTCGPPRRSGPRWAEFVQTYLAEPAGAPGCGRPSAVRLAGDPHTLASSRVGPGVSRGAAARAAASPAWSRSRAGRTSAAAHADWSGGWPGQPPRLPGALFQIGQDAPQVPRP
jgi:hypothetical protein